MTRTLKRLNELMVTARANNWLVLVASTFDKAEPWNGEELTKEGQGHTYSVTFASPFSGPVPPALKPLMSFKSSDHSTAPVIHRGCPFLRYEDFSDPETRQAADNFRTWAKLRNIKYRVDMTDDGTLNGKPMRLHRSGEVPLAEVEEVMADVHPSQPEAIPVMEELAQAERLAGRAKFNVDNLKRQLADAEEALDEARASIEATRYKLTAIDSLETR